VSASIGITLYPADGKTADELLKSADLAMYQAKEHGKNSYQYYLDSMNVAAYQRLSLENKLRKAIENHQLFLHYQPQINARTGEIVGLEALLRWYDPEEGFIPPNVFIPVAEVTGLILPIGEWVLHEACRQARAWQKAGYPLVIMSVNVSSVQFNRQDVAQVIQKALDSSKLYPPFLEIEITESAIMSQTDHAEEALSAVRALGVKIALDDFGTAYSSLSYLRHFPIDTLKIDRSFIIDIDTNQECAEIVEAISAMAHAFFASASAPGVGWDVGAIYYSYPGAEADLNYDYGEACSTLNYSFEAVPLQPEIGVGLYYSPEYFGDSGKATYTSGTLQLSLPEEFGINFTAGKQWFDEALDYLDWKLGVTKGLAGFDFEIAYTDTDLSKSDCGGESICAGRAIFSVSRTLN